MTVLFIGLGAVGQRHLRNLIKLIPDVKIIAYRQRGLNFVLNDKLEIIDGENLEEKYNITVYHDLGEALAQKPDIAFITNPTSLHIETALKAAEAGCCLFLEKPISHNMNNVQKLLNIINEKQLVSFVGYQNRFHPCIKKAKELLDAGVLGDIIALNIENGEDIRSWHKYEDYRGAYAARKELGGGAAVTQIHEIDYVHYFFGMPLSAYAIGGKLSSLEINVEDTVSVLLKYNLKGKHIPVHIHEDYIQTPPSRSCKIIGDNGKLIFDLINNSIIVYDAKANVVFNETYVDFVRNNMFEEELALFLDCVKERRDSFLPAKEGVKSLKVALAIQKSLETGEIIKIENKGE